MKLKRLLEKYWKTGLFVLAGAIAGFAYWRFVGCTSGSCPLTANWHTSTLWGGLIGLVASPSRKKNEKSESLTQSQSATGNNPVSNPDVETGSDPGVK